MADQTKESAKCFFCNKKVPWTAEGLVCKCRNIFCDKHRFPEDHKCTFNYFEEHKQELIRKNPKVLMQGVGAYNIGQFKEAWNRQHPDLGFRVWHSIGFLIFCFFFLKGLLFSGMLGQVLGFFQNILYGYCIGFAVAHGIPSYVKKNEPNRIFHSSPLGGCRCCFFSWDLLSSPSWVLECENEQLLKMFLNLVTASGTNCLGHLNRDPSWGKTVDGVVKKVSGQT